MDPILTLLIGIILGALTVTVVSFLLAKSKFDTLKLSAEDLKIQNVSLEQEFTHSENLLNDSESSKELTLSENAQLKDENIQLQVKAASLQSEVRYQNELIEQQKNMSEAQENKLKLIQSKALEENSETFLNKASNDLIQPMKNELTNNLQKLETNLNRLNNMEKQFISTTAQIKEFREINREMRDETANLASALRGTPGTPGRYGEFTLERIAELSGMVEHCDFVQQHSMTTSEGKLDRPDMIVRMPSNRQLVVDAKTSIQAYLNSIDATNEQEKQAFLKQHAQQLKERAIELSRKGYWSSLEYTPEVVIMFVPGDHFLLAAVKEDNTLIDKAMESKVLIASPTFLVGLLKVIALGWDRDEASKHVKEIREIGSELYNRIATWAEHLDKVGQGLQSATNSYNAAMASLDSRVLPGIRKLPELGISTDKTIKEEPKLLYSNIREIPQSLRTTSENEHKDAI